MSEPPRKLRATMTVGGILWWVRWSIVVTICTLLLGTGVFLSSRYTANRRLMKVEDEFDNGVDVDWKGPNIDVLNRTIGAEKALALLSRPVVMSVGGRGRPVPDRTVLRLLHELAGLERIDIMNRLLPPGCLEVIATQHRVKNLSFHLPGISTADAHWLSRMPLLEQVHFTQPGGKSGKNDWSWLKALPKLKWLYVHLSAWGVVTDRDVIALAECPALRHLSISGETLSDEALVRLCDLPELTQLSIHGTTFRLHFPAGRKFPATLRELSLSSKQLDDESLAAIADLSELTRVTFSFGSLTDAGMDVLARLPKLDELWIDYADLLSDAGMERLSASQSLKTVYVRQTHIGARGLCHLLTLPNWTRICVGDVEFERQPGGPGPSLTFEEIEELFTAERARRQAAFR